MGLLDGAFGLAGSAISAKAQKDIAEKNIKAQERAQDLAAAIARENMAATKGENQTQRDFGLKLLDMSKPNLGSKELGDLIFSQDEQANNEAMDRGLATTLRQNLRTGSPLSAADIAAKFSEQSAAARGDRRSQATLKGILGTLPGAAAQQSAGALFGSTQTPLNTYQPQAILQDPKQTNIGDLIALAGFSLPSMAKSGMNAYNASQSGGTGLGDILAALL